MVIPHKHDQKPISWVTLNSVELIKLPQYIYVWKLLKNNHKEEKTETIVKKNSKIVLKNSQQIISLQQQHRTRQKIRTLENKQA